MLNDKVIDEDGSIRYYKDGKLHREDGPAIEWSNGSKFWWLNDKLHREDGPAVERYDGNKFWYLNGKLHREDGPAIEWWDGTKYWYLNDEEYTEKEWKKEVKKLNKKQNGESKMDSKNVKELAIHLNLYNTEKQKAIVNILEKDFNMPTKNIIKELKSSFKIKCNKRYIQKIRKSLKENKSFDMKNGKVVDKNGKVVNEYGNIRYYKDDKLHREDGPAIEYTDGTKSWWLNGKCHREDGPAVELSDGSKFWYLNGKYHREDGPAIEWYSGSKEWWLNGKRHREDGPAVEYANGTKVWYLNNKRHREDGPAVEWYDGTKYWYLNDEEYTEKEWKKEVEKLKKKIIKVESGVIKKTDEFGHVRYFKKGLLHREDGPAIEYTDGSKEWYKNGELHREDGPAITWPDNADEEWWLNGSEYTKEGWKIKLDEIKSEKKGKDRNMNDLRDYEISIINAANQGCNSIQEIAKETSYAEILIRNVLKNNKNMIVCEVLDEEEDDVFFNFFNDKTNTVTITPEIENDYWEVDLPKTITSCSEVQESIDVFFNKNAKFKASKFMKWANNKEWLAYLVGEKKEDGYYIKDLYLPDQDASSTLVHNVDAEEYNKLNIVGVIHSHHNMGAGSEDNPSFSGHDDEYINGNHNLSLLAGKSGNGFKIVGIARVKTPCGGLVNIKVEVKQVKLPKTKKEKELKKEFKKKVLKPIKSVISYSGANPNYGNCNNGFYKFNKRYKGKVVTRRSGFHFSGGTVK